ncbi:hypothetical protein HPP92_015808 [Vanilla planifolia]|uniref:Pentatricopeptide repeat-containing protein n=1 Tax=Vanilla planifolia TaxID=51239 RepID=A0A835URG4_VANPL|nr:hypothetical protein HPP92_016423 [Vanilla planifolia]KAG0471262.1 hypothetical protein HPP92_015808 [Vanilla planifolia]
MAHSRALQLVKLLQPCIQKKLLLSGKAVHAQALTSGLSFDTFLSNRLVELYSRCDLFDYAFNAFYSIPNPNVFSWNAILSATAKAASFELAFQLFEQMPERNVVSWNTMISALARRGQEEKAVELYHGMVQQGLMPSHFTFASVLSAFSSLMDLSEGRKCHGLAVKVGLDVNLFVENALLAMYTKCESLVDAVKLFEDMPDPNEVSFTALMGGLVQSGLAEEALRLFTRMHRCGISVDQISVSSVLGACAKFHGAVLNPDEISSYYAYGQVIHALVLRHGFESELHVGNSLIDMYAKHGNMDNADLIFKTMPEINVVSWNVMISGYGQNGDANKAIEMWQLMQQSHFEADEVTYISLLSSCVKSGDTETATQFFYKMNSPSVASWNALLSVYSQNEWHKEGIELFRKMLFLNAEPNRTTFAVVLSSCSGTGLLEYGKQLHASSVRYMLHEDMFVSSGLVDMYSKCGHIDAARRVFDGMCERDVVSWNSMIAAFSRHSLDKECFSFFKLMREDHMSPTESSYASLANCCARLSSLPQGRQIHAQILKDGYDADVYVGSSLIDMYTKCGFIVEARRFFDSMPTKNIVSWNEMIHGYAQNGYGEEAIVLFEYMLRSKEKPDAVTFIGVLTACSHCGFVDEGIKFFDSMKNEHGIEPLADHYTCILDALGRAGRLSEAKLLLDRMPCNDDPIVWEVVLASCVVHGDISLGTRAAEELFRIDPNNSAPYVLLANMYASKGRWFDASAVRKLMSERRVVKDRGYSWINQKGDIRVFMVDDCLESVNCDRGKSNCDAHLDDFVAS